MRIIQRFGRIDRLGSRQRRSIQLVNFWPNMELDEYIDLEARVAGRMVLLDISATGEENVIEYAEVLNAMNDLEYRRRQLHQLQHEVTQHRGPLRRHLDHRPDAERLPHGSGRVPRRSMALDCERMPLGAFAVTPIDDLIEGEDLAPECDLLSAATMNARRSRVDPTYRPGAVLPGVRGRRRRGAAQLHPHPAGSRCPQAA
ncbi:MAG: hypothetical protein U5L11_00980 [Arhodomonas sp.]|nr:hypothetical protein [Arhodomonas sp.]